MAVPVYVVLETAYGVPEPPGCSRRVHEDPTARDLRLPNDPDHSLAQPAYAAAMRSDSSAARCVWRMPIDIRSPLPASTE